MVEILYFNFFDSLQQVRNSNMHYIDISETSDVSRKCKERFFRGNFITKKTVFSLNVLNT